MSVDRQIRIAAVSACLSLVRPVGMTEEETEDWLNVAADTLDEIPADIVERGARIARTRCTHHAQIIPTIFAETKDDVAWRNRPRTPPVLQLVRSTDPLPPLPERPLPDPETMWPEFRNMGLSRKWLVRGDDGRLIWAKEEGGDAA